MKKNKKLLILGSNSFIGLNLLKSKNIKNYNVYLASKNDNKHSKKLEFYKLDLKNTKETKNIIYKINPHYIIHLADTKTKKN